MKRRAFTIIELMMVIAIIAVLMTISVTAVSGILKRARVQRADALCNMVRQGLCTYYAQKGEWPWGDKQSTSTEDSYYWLTASEIRNAIYELVKEAKAHNPMMDISGLYVSENQGEPGSSKYGMEFMAAVMGTKRHPDKIPASRLYYGYPESEHGYFRRFVIKYSPVSDSIIVRTFTSSEEKARSEQEEEAQ